MTFEAIFTYATLGVTVLHKLIDVARLIAASTPSPKDDAVVEEAATWLDKASTALGYLPALRLKVSK